jgi:hypothetical protein
MMKLGRDAMFWIAVAAIFIAVGILLDPLVGF